MFNLTPDETIQMAHIILTVACSLEILVLGTLLIEAI